MYLINFFAKNLSRKSNLDDSGVSLPVFASGTNLKLHNISVTAKVVEISILTLIYQRRLHLIVFHWLF